MERGLNVELGAKGMRVQLQQWVNISTQFKGMATVGSNGLTSPHNSKVWLLLEDSACAETACTIQEPAVGLAFCSGIVLYMLTLDNQCLLIHGKSRSWLTVIYIHLSLQFLYI